jgi:L-threonylcarbamoyladenylate synthase
MPDPLSHDPLAAARILIAGGVVAFPTETVYGLGAHAEHRDAVRRVFAIKGRPAGHPLIVHGPDASMLDRYARRASRDVRRLAEALWPGPLTLVVARSPSVPDAVTGGRETVGLRVPDQPLAHEMLSAVGAGVAAPSANIFGRISPTTAAHVLGDIGGQVDLILDGGPCTVGVESTILDLSTGQPTILRAGGIPRDAIEALLGQAVVASASGPARAPGMLAAHYAPNATVVLITEDQVAPSLHTYRSADQRVALISTVRLDTNDPGTIVLRPAGERPEDFAHDLYRLLRDADAAMAEIILVVPPPGDGIAVAVRDRLERAAHAGRIGPPRGGHDDPSTDGIR